MRDIRTTPLRLSFLIGACLFCLPPDASGQDGAPPPGYPAVLRDVRLAFPTQDGTALGPVEDYLQIIALPRENALRRGPTWTFYARVEPMILDSAQRLWASGRFHSVWVDVEHDPFPNGADGERVIFNLVERIQPGPPPAGLPQPPSGYELPPPSHERVYPPPRRD
jgi:hypothetical protein